MNIAVVGNAADTLIKFRSSFIRRLVADHHHVIVMIPEFSEADKEVLEGMGVKVVKVSFSRFGINPLKEMASLSKGEGQKGETNCRFFLNIILLFKISTTPFILY